MHMHLVKPQLLFSIKAIESYVQSPIPLGFLYTVNSRPADTSLLQTRASPLLKCIKKWL